MWHNNKTVNRTFATHHGQNAWAIINTIAGWKKIKTGNEDGVTNLFVALNAARANDRPVDVFINDTTNEIERIVMR